MRLDYFDRYRILEVMTLSQLKKLAKACDIKLYGGERGSLLGKWKLTERIEIVKYLSHDVSVTKNRIDKVLQEKTRTRKKVKKRVSLTSSDRDKVLRRQNYKCAGRGCDKDLTRTVQFYDHVKAIALGGPDILDNIQALCGTCNAEKTRRDRDKIAKRKRKTRRQSS